MEQRLVVLGPACPGPSPGFTVYTAGLLQGTQASLSLSVSICEVWDNCGRLMGLPSRLSCLYLSLCTPADTQKALDTSELIL